MCNHVRSGWSGEVGKSASFNTGGMRAALLINGGGGGGGGAEVQYLNAFLFFRS